MRLPNWSNLVRFFKELCCYSLVLRHLEQLRKLPDLQVWNRLVFSYQRLL
jgi:hypothetical protein